MSPLHWRDANAPPVDRVTPVELFFDVVFVFTLTQLTRTLEAGLSLRGTGRVLLIFGVLWWIAAVGTPRAFDSTGIVFGAGYLTVICVHLLLFTQSDARAGVARLAPYNIGAALLVLAAGFVRGTSMYALWVAAFLLMAVVPYLVPRHSWVGVAQTFHVAPAHFVERHGLLVIIALGESVIAIGAGVDVTHLTLGTIAVVVLALALPGALWWAYFMDAAAAEHALTSADAAARSFMAIRAYFFAHIPVLLGIIVAAAGVHAVIAHPAEATQWSDAFALAGGIALFLLGIAACRRSLAIGSAAHHLVAAAGVLASAPLGVLAVAGVQLLVVLGVVVAMLIADQAKRPAHGARGVHA